MRTPTVGYEAEPSDVATEVTNWLGDITDPSERYARATSAQAHHEAVVTAMQRERDKVLAALNAGSDEEEGLSYEKLTEMTGLTRAGVQKAVERGRSS